MNIIKIIYKISRDGLAITDHDLARINFISAHNYFAQRLDRFSQLNYQVDFDSFENKDLEMELKLLNSDLPQILAYIVKNKRSSGFLTLEDAVVELRKSNPMDYDLSQGHPFYEYRLMNLILEASAKNTTNTKFSNLYRLFEVESSVDFSKLFFSKDLKTLWKTYKIDFSATSYSQSEKVFKNSNGSFIKLNFQLKSVNY
ncbi:MAG: HpaII family restriction endonuclease [Leeuwenhoekiella sp.]